MKVFSNKMTDGGDSIETIFGPKTQFTGMVRSEGMIRIDGHIEGNIVADKGVIVGSEGCLIAHVKSRTATIAGSVQGNLDVLEKVELLSTGKIIGDIRCGSLSVSVGAVFRGASLSKKNFDEKL